STRRAWGPTGATKSPARRSRRRSPKRGSPAASAAGGAGAAGGATAQPRPAVGALIITNDRWNSRMPSVGVIAIRRSVDPGEAPYATRLDAGSFAVAPRLVSVLAPEDADSPLGSLVSVISPAELEAVEDRLCSFLQLPG